jgi:hypothetical protein
MIIAAAWSVVVLVVSTTSSAGLNVATVAWKLS